MIMTPFVFLNTSFLLKEHGGGGHMRGSSQSRTTKKARQRQPQQRQQKAKAKAAKAKAEKAAAKAAEKTALTAAAAQAAADATAAAIDIIREQPARSSHFQYMCLPARAPHFFLKPAALIHTKSRPVHGCESPLVARRERALREAEVHSSVQVASPPWAFLAQIRPKIRLLAVGSNGQIRKGTPLALIQPVCV